MYKPFQLFAGLRYLRFRRHNQFLSFISWFSLLGLVLQRGRTDDVGDELGQNERAYPAFFCPMVLSSHEVN